MKNKKITIGIGIMLVAILAVSVVALSQQQIVDLIKSKYGQNTQVAFGGDLAEIRLINDADENMTGGDVVCFQVDEKVGACSNADPTVAGVLTDNPGYVMITPKLQAILTANDSLSRRAVPVAIRGIVPLHVNCDGLDGEGISAGDILVSHSSKGKAQDSARLKTIITPVDTWNTMIKISAMRIGKAMSNCTLGTGDHTIQAMIG